MSKWHRAQYGEPCRECEFVWPDTVDTGVTIVGGVPNALRSVLSSATGHEHSDLLGWTTGQYVCHVADNLRIFAERLIGATHFHPIHIAPYDPDELARARHYEAVTLPAALWSVDRSVSDWTSAVRAAPANDDLFVHDEFGSLALLDVVAANAHDVAHHLWDIARIMQQTSMAEA